MPGGWDEEGELAIVDLIEAYEVKRWPLCEDPNVPRAKGIVLREPGYRL
jgi:hypothetical protein